MGGHPGDYVVGVSPVGDGRWTGQQAHPFDSLFRPRIDATSLLLVADPGTDTRGGIGAGPWTLSPGLMAQGGVQVDDPSCSKITERELAWVCSGWHSVTAAPGGAATTNTASIGATAGPIQPAM